MQRLISLLLFALIALGGRAQEANYHVIPRPAFIGGVSNVGDFILTPDALIIAGKSEGEQRCARFLQQFVAERTGFRLPIVSKPTKKHPSGNIELRVNCEVSCEVEDLIGNTGHCDRLDTSTKDKRKAAKAMQGQLCPNGSAEAYEMMVSDAGIVIAGATDAGLFYGVQTLRKSLPHCVPGHTTGVRCSAVYIGDRPRFAYRGAHLDVARHYVTPDSIHRFLDMCAMHNINRFHWHITDDQGWRFEVKKYPRLTEVGSRRSETVIGHNSGVYDGKPYGGYYTQDECREIVRYAAERGITVIPEIDMPGHMQGALAAYPELGCTGGPYEVWRIWGVSDEVLCAGNDRVLQFIDDVLDEVADVFPSEYIHVGGDECPKTAWAKCPKCQARIKAEHLEARDGHTAEERLQSYVIRHAEQHLASLGRRMIGWDETLEGGLAPDATVMSWRGEAGGIEAARQHHQVIMTPNTYLYFDYYQAKDVSREPDAIGGCLTLETVYNYEPQPETMDDELASYIIGVQANLWTEYMPNYRQVEYMELPRMAALSEIQWTPKGTKNYADFCERLLRHFSLYEEQGYNYGHHIYNVRADYDVNPDNHAVSVVLSTVDNAEVHYTLDGSDPTPESAVYTGPLNIIGPAQFRAAAFRRGPAHPNSAARGLMRSAVESQDIVSHLATACPVTLLEPTNAAYTYRGARQLTDGICAGSMNFRSGEWLGFCGNDCVAIIDLGSERRVSSVSFNALVNSGDWIFAPRDFAVQGLRVYPEPLNAGQAWFNILGDVFESYPAMTADDSRNGRINHYSLEFEPFTARFVKVVINSEHTIPDWHGGRGKNGFLFIDEIVVK